ncbi:GL15000 [Drosophila persimilis]|uniref:GL15000 n=1 Tax=Drosophila persimilis TaxID=7234 RepID=B4H0K7_DROPE|nr:GL15000 [Drosophila persimilis]
MENAIKKEAEGSDVETEEKFEGITVDAADQQLVASYRRYSPDLGSSFSDSSTDSSDTSNSWDYKRRGVNNKKLHKMRAAAMRLPKAPSLSPNARTSSSSSPSSPGGADAEPEKPISPPSGKRLKISDITSELESSEASASNVGIKSDSHRKRLEVFQQNLRVVNERIAKKYSELNCGGLRAEPGTIRRLRGGACVGINKFADNPKTNPETKTEEKSAKKN